MHYVLFTGAFLFLAFIAPLKATLLTAAVLLIVTTVVKIFGVTFRVRYRLVLQHFPGLPRCES